MKSEITKPKRAASALSSKGKSVQAKLMANQPGDRYEQEADAMADRVMSMNGDSSFEPTTGMIGKSIQRKCTECEEEERKKKTIMRKESTSGGGSEVSNNISGSLNRGGGMSIPPSTLNFMDGAFSRDFSSVRIHTGGEAIRMTSDLNARAFTYGNSIYFNSNQFSPQTDQGKWLLAHELTHVVQQSGSIGRKIQRAVDKVEINCADNQIRFDHDSTTTAYALDRCQLTDGTYNAGVKLSPNRVDFDLGVVASGTQFDFSYSIAPGQPNPNSFFKGQSRVNITCTNTSSLFASPGDIKFNVRQLSAEQFYQMTGNSIDSIPEGMMVPLSNFINKSLPSAIGPATAGASYYSPTPWSFIPKNVTGVLWTQGHTSVFSNPGGVFSPTIKGYRGNLGYYAGESLPWIGRQCTIRLHEGVPGSFANDAWFPLMPGKQYYVFAPRSGDQALDFARRLGATEYGGDYTYSPPRSNADPILREVRPTESVLHSDLVKGGKAPMCTNNCITVPKAEIEAAMGGRPVTNSGVDVMTGLGPEGVDPHYAGRGRLMTEAMGEGPLPPGASRMNITVTPGGSAGMFIFRGAGSVMLVYGIYHTGSRIANAPAEELPIVLSEEAGSWTGGILGSALGGAAAGAVFCAPTGPVDAVCVVGGFVGGLLFGIAGSTVGQAVGNTVGEYVVNPIFKKINEVEASWTREIYNLYGVPYF